MKALNSTWLTTFGDVLTLLLCFVLVTATNLSGNSGQKNESIQIDRESGVVANKSYDTLGKPFASKIVSEYRQHDLILNSADFDLGQNAFSAQGLRKLSELNLKELQRFELGICNLDQNYVESLYRYLVSQTQLNADKVMSGNLACRLTKDLNREPKQKSLLIRAWLKDG